MHITPTAHLYDAGEHLAAAISQYDPSDTGALFDGLANVTQATALLDVARDVLVHDARHARMTWDEIGQALGVTRSAAQQRFRHIEP